MFMSSSVQRGFYITRHRIWLLGLGAGIVVGIGVYYIWKRSKQNRRLQVDKADTLSVLSDDSFTSACDDFVNLCEIPSSADKDSASKEFILPLYNNGCRVIENGDLKYRKSRYGKGQIKTGKNYRLTRPTLSVLSDDTFISACDEFVNLCEIPSSGDRLSASTDFTMLPLYNVGLKAAERGDVKYRKSRAEVCGCDSEQDFAAKLFGIRLAFRYLMDDPQTMQRLVQYGRIVMGDLLRHDKRDPTEFYAAYNRMIAFLNDENNLDTIHSELLSRKVESTNLWDTLFDLIILDAFEDLQRPPSAISALVKNSFISKSMKESTLNNFIWSIIKVKRQRLQVKDGFISHFYDISQILTSSLAMGLFGGSDREYHELCIYLKEHIFGFILEIFNPNKVRFTRVEDLARDIKKILFERMELLQVKLLNELLPT